MVDLHKVRIKRISTYLMTYFRFFICLSIFYLGACSTPSPYQTTYSSNQAAIQYDNSYSVVKKRAIFTGPSGEGGAIVNIRYDGDFQYGKANGKGEQTYLDGPRISDSYKGLFKDGLRNGYGTYSFGKSGDWYEGYFFNGAMNGAGKYTFGNGTYFIGGFKDNLRDGNSSLYSAGGIKIADQIWKAGILISSTEKKAPPSREAYIKTPNTTLDTQDSAEEKAKKCVRLGMAPGSSDYKICLATQK